MRKKILMNENDQIGNRQWSIICGGLIGLNIVLLQGFLGVGIKDVSTFISILAFTLSIPLLGGALLQLILEADTGYFVDGKLSSLPEYRSTTGAIITLIGLGATLWHLMWLMGVLFIVAVVAVAIIFIIRYPSYEEKKQPLLLNDDVDDGF